MSDAACPDCGAHDFSRIPGPSVGRFHVARCTGCGHVATRPEPEDEELSAFYGEEYYGPDHQRFSGPFEMATTIFRRWRAWYIAHRRPPGTVLDVGCGTGLLLEEFRRRGWTVLGTELDDEAAAHARDTLGISVATGEFHQLEIPPASVDVVVMWQTFEHMREPVAVLRRVREVLRPGGWAIISVPNRESWQARLTGPHWHHLDLPRHLHHYGASSLRRMLEREGFRVIRTEHFNSEQNPFGWLQSLLNMTTGSSGALFDSMRKGPEGARAKLPLASLALLPLLAPASLLLAAVESLAGRGGTVTLWATI